MIGSEPPAVSIIVPTFQEAPNLRLLVYEISSAIASSLPTWELIIVDDNSQDGSLEVCRNLRAEGLPIRLVVRTNERGLSSAVVEGFAHARAPVLVVMDADLSHPATAILHLYTAIIQGAEFAIGSRYIPGGGTDDRWSMYRWLNSKVASLLAKPLISLSDPTAGFFALPRSLLWRCENLNPIGYKIALEILVKSRAMRIRETPIQFRTRQYGKSKLKLKQQLLYLRHLCALYHFKFLHASARQRHVQHVQQPSVQPIRNEEKVLQ